jgi:AAHS family 4-hydroxybenzoate transporter-like MFS transporter
MVEVINVGAVLDRARFGPVQARVLGLSFLALTIDGFDIQSAAFAAPALTTAWGIERAALGPVLAAALVGMAVGAALFGLVGDRYGRRMALIVSSALMALGSFLSAASDGPEELAVYRCVTGLGLGGALPNATALIVEFAPRAWRQLIVTIVVVGVPVGGMIGALIARAVIPASGWSAIFLIGGVLPAVLTLVMPRMLPESPRFLAKHPGRRMELASLLERVARERLAEGAAFDAEPAQTDTDGLLSIFGREYRRDTLALWIVFFTNVFAVYTFFNCLPTVLAAVNVSLAVAITGSFAFNVGSIVGALLGAIVIGRIGSRPVLIVLAAASVAATLAVGRSEVFASGSGDRGLTLLLWLMSLAGCCIGAVQAGMYSVAAHVYPTSCRSTGVGWALGFARLGGILSSFAGAALFSIGFGGAALFTGIAAMLVVTTIGILLVQRHIPAGA